MRLQRQEHVILRPELDRAVRRGDPHHRLAARLLQGEAVANHGGEVRSAGDEADLDLAFGGEPGADQPADGAGAEDADLHAILSLILRCAAKQRLEGSDARRRAWTRFLEPSWFEARSARTSP